MKISILFVTFLFLSCSARTEKYINIELGIEKGSSYKYDFQKEIYTVFYMDKSPLEIKFKLSDEEKKMISKKYYELKLNELSAKITIEGDCNIDPVIFTSLHIKNNKGVQEIQIEEGCSDFNFLNEVKAKRVNAFLEYIRKILNTRPEIKNLPKSNVMYM